ncbi:MAG: hypothetical protein AB7Q17_02000 [Phycisphaerae bacterium]
MPQGTNAGLHQLIGDVQSQRAALDTQRRIIDEQIAALERAMIALNGAGRRAGAPRAQTARGAAPAASAPPASAHRPGSLKEFIGKALAAGGRVMSVKEITAAVMRGGYKSKNKTLAKSVGIALTEMREARKVGHGRFRLK